MFTNLVNGRVRFIDFSAVNINDYELSTRRAPTITQYNQLYIST